MLSAPGAVLASLLARACLANASTHFSDEPGSCQIIGNVDVYGIYYLPYILNISLTTIHRDWHPTGLLPSICRCDALRYHRPNR